MGGGEGRLLLWASLLFDGEGSGVVGREQQQVSLDRSLFCFVPSQTRLSLRTHTSVCTLTLTHAHAQAFLFELSAAVRSKQRLRQKYEKDTSR